VVPAVPPFTYRLDHNKLRTTRRREGRYLLRTYLTEHDPAKLWTYYLQLVTVEEAFKDLKGDLAIRPIFHQVKNGSRHAHLHRLSRLSVAAISALECFFCRVVNMSNGPSYSAHPDRLGHGRLGCRRVGGNPRAAFGDGNHLCPFAFKFGVRFIALW
jgi:hypothetical protein